MLLYMQDRKIKLSIRSKVLLVCVSSCQQGASGLLALEVRLKER